MRAPRSLHPAHLQVVAGELWVIDAVQPVAAVVEPATGELDRLVGWPQVPPWHEASEREWRTLSDGDALWVQSGFGPPARVTADGAVVATVRTTGTPERWRLAAAGPGGAWLAADPPPQDLADAADAPPPWGTASRLLAATASGEVREVVVEHGVHDVLGGDDGVLIQVDTGRGERRDLGQGTWSWEPSHEWLLVPWTDQARVVSTATHRTVPPPRLPSPRLPGWSFLWHDPDPEDGGPTEARRWDVSGDLSWHLGWEGSGSTPRRAVATGHDESGRRETLRVDLGPGTVLAALGMHDRLYVALADRQQPGALVAVDPGTGAVTEALAAGSVDVAAYCRPPGPAPADLRSYTRFWLRYWADEAGVVEPFESGMSNARVELVDDWPSTTVEVTFDWAPRPGVRLRRRVPLFDELGRHTPPEYSSLHLGEDLATGQVPPAPANGGFLDL